MVSPRNASTVVLLRPDSSGNFEILLTRRPEEMRFLGGFYVFPGGTVHRDDYAPKILDRCRTLTGAAARQILRSQLEPDEAIGHWVAVVRELFEEVAILLCTTAEGTELDLSDLSTARRIERQRQAIVKGELAFGTFLESENLFCDLARVIYFDHWVTPEIYSMRFDTRFYLAVAPPNQIPLARSEEVTHSLWLKPADALARMNRRDFPILPPTTTVLNNLARLESWAHVRAEFNIP
jgi:8-oxo-dGTP pyrophosphatase MutT (NUDIX family)